MIKEAIAKLIEGVALGREEARSVMIEIMSGEATAAQIASYITALRLRGESPEIIAGSAAAMREKFTAIQAPGGIVVDTCGTGGDGAQTFNISTAAAFVAAGAGLIVAKHGNRGVSSRCGSADVLAALGVRVDVEPESMTACLASIGMAFLFAPTLHPAMKHAIGPRRELGIRTIFNVLGPLSNPAGARHGVLGVYHPDLVPRLAGALAELGAAHVFVVHGHDGLDELTTTTSSLVAETRNGNVRTFELQPEDLGLARARIEDLRGGEAEENAAIIREILDGAAGPRRDIVLLNASAALVAGEKAGTLAEALPLAAASIDSGAARAKLEALARMTQTAAP